MSKTSRALAMVLLLHAAGLSASTPRWQSEPPRRQGPHGRPGLNLDMEACVEGDCIRASDSGTVTLFDGEAWPVRIRLHLACAEDAPVRGIARVARVVLVPAGAWTIHCPREPTNAYCEFMYWEGDPRWEKDVAADYMPWSADTPWPEADDRVDEAEFVLDAARDIPPGLYDLIAALPGELVDEYPCESIRNHRWVESPPLRVRIGGARERAAWLDGLASLHLAGVGGDVESTQDGLDRLLALARTAPEGVVPSSSDVEAAFMKACEWLDTPECESEGVATSTSGTVAADFRGTSRRGPLAEGVQVATDGSTDAGRAAEAFLADFAKDFEEAITLRARDW